LPMKESFLAVRGKSRGIEDERKLFNEKRFVHIGPREINTWPKREEKHKQR